MGQNNPNICKSNPSIKKQKKKNVDWDKNALPFISLLPLIISHLLLNLTFYRMAPHLLLKKS